MKRKLTASLLVLLIGLSSLGSAACDRDQVRQTREAAERLIIYSEAGIHIIEELKESGALTGGLEEPSGIALRGLALIRDTTQAFVERAKGYVKFDPSSRADLAQAFTDVTTALKELQPQVELVARRVIEVLNANRITAIKDPGAIVRRLNLAVTVLNTSARLIQARIRP